MEQMTGPLIERLARLEGEQARLHRANRRLRITMGALFAVAGALVLMAQASRDQTQTVVAQQFVLRDSSGNVRGAIGVLPDGSVGFNLADKKGQTRVTVDLADNGSPGVDLYDQSGKLRATFALGPSGTPGLGLYDASGKLRTSLDVPAPETPGLAFYHATGKPAWGAP